MLDRLRSMFAPVSPKPSVQEPRDYSQRLGSPISDFVRAAMPYSNWGVTYFNIRLMELTLIDSLLGGPIQRGGHRMLDFGCGIGLACVYASRYFEQVDGVDIDEIGVAYKIDKPAPDVGSALLPSAGVANVSLHTCDTFTFLDERPDHYDFILSVFALEHVDDILGVCDRFASALKVGGRCVHVVPNTHDAANQLLIQNLRPVAENEAAIVRSGRGVRRMGEWYAPITHSEFIEDYRQQFDINSLERFTFPMVASGLRVEKITPVREHSYAVLATKASVMPISG